MNQPIEKTQTKEFKVNTLGKTRQEIDHLLAVEESILTQTFGFIDTEVKEYPGYAILICKK